MSLANLRYNLARVSRVYLMNNSIRLAHETFTAPLPPLKGHPLPRALSASLLPIHCGTHCMGIRPWRSTPITLTKVTSGLRLQNPKHMIFTPSHSGFSATFSTAEFFLLLQGLSTLSVSVTVPVLFLPSPKCDCASGAGLNLLVPPTHAPQPNLIHVKTHKCISQFVPLSQTPHSSTKPPHLCHT